MQHTKKYNLSLIETSDTFSPDTLNANTQQVEDTMAAHESSVETRLTTHETAVEKRLSAHESSVSSSLAALAAADTANKAALEATHKADKAALEATLNAHTAALKLRNCQYYLSSYTGNGKTGPYTFNFPRKPIFFFVAAQWLAWLGGVQGCPMAVGYQSLGDGNVDPLTWSGTSVTVGTSSTPPKFAFNAANTKYYVFAILEAEN